MTDAPEIASGDEAPRTAPAERVLAETAEVLIVEASVDEADRPDAARIARAVLGIRQSAAIGTDFRPEQAVLHVPCPSCGSLIRIEGPVEWRYRDDDRFAESEDGFGGILVGTCPACGTSARAEVLMSVTESRFDRAREITWDAVS